MQWPFPLLSLTKDWHIFISPNCFIEWYHYIREYTVFMLKMAYNQQNITCPHPHILCHGETGKAMHAS